MSHYFVELLASGSQFLNALTAGNRDQTFSARCYEAISTGRWWWYPPYLAVNAGAALWEMVNSRPVINHCRDAFENGDAERTYA